jgi:hypothetical protein
MEYNNNTVGGSSCSYASLSTYNNGSKGMSPPVPATTVSGVYVVPSWSAASYNTLSHDSAPSCSGYFSVTNAYGKNANNCSTKFVQKLCQ